MPIQSHWNGCLILVCRETLSKDVTKDVASEGDALTHKGSIQVTSSPYHPATIEALPVDHQRLLRPNSANSCSIRALPWLPNITPTKLRPLVSGLNHSICYQLQAFQLRSTFLLCPECDCDEVLPLVVEDAFRYWELGLWPKMVD